MVIRRPCRASPSRRHFSRPASCGATSKRPCILQSQLVITALSRVPNRLPQLFLSLRLIRERSGRNGIEHSRSQGLRGVAGPSVRTSSTRPLREMLASSNFPARSNPNDPVTITFLPCRSVFNGRPIAAQSLTETIASAFIEVGRQNVRKQYSSWSASSTRGLIFLFR